MTVLFVNFELAELTDGLRVDELPPDEGVLCCFPATLITPFLIFI